MMASLLVRLGTLLLVGDLIYLAVGEWILGGADNHLFRTILASGALSLVGGFALSFLQRARSEIIGPTCPSCGKRVARGRVYCEDHLVETINRYRDEQRQKRK
jgi:hypothetical protein